MLHFRGSSLSDARVQYAVPSSHADKAFDDPARSFPRIGSTCPAFARRAHPEEDARICMKLTKITVRTVRLLLTYWSRDRVDDFA